MRNPLNAVANTASPFSSIELTAGAIKSIQVLAPAAALNSTVVLLLNWVA